MKTGNSSSLSISRMSWGPTQSISLTCHLFFLLRNAHTCTLMGADRIVCSSWLHVLVRPRLCGSAGLLHQWATSIFQFFKDLSIYRNRDLLGCHVECRDETRNATRQTRMLPSASAERGREVTKPGALRCMAQRTDETTQQMHQVVLPEDLCTAAIPSHRNHRRPIAVSRTNQLSAFLQLSKA